MKEVKNREITLSIETAIGGGSLAIFEDRRWIAVWTGGRQVSKAEDLLERIAELLTENNIVKEQLKLICVSKGIGSLTGEKIGRAVAKGLSKAFGCRLVEISVLDALLSELPSAFSGQVITAVPIGKDRIVWRHRVSKDLTLTNMEVSKTYTNTTGEFYEMLGTSANIQFVIFRDSSDLSPNIPPFEGKRIIIADQNPAVMIGS